MTDREISWLAFDQRVLELAEDAAVPLLERLRFLAIFSSNLDEFFMVRVATLMSKIENQITAPNVAGITPQDLMGQISTKTRELVARAYKSLHDDLMPQLKVEGIEFVQWGNLNENERVYVDKLFEERVFPVLTPLAVDPSHPFPYISGLSLNLAVIVKNPQTQEESEDILLTLEAELARRRFGPPVRLEIETGVDARLVDRLASQLGIAEENIIHSPLPLDLTALHKIADIGIPRLKYERFSSASAHALSEVDPLDTDLFFAAIRQGEILLHHPYESFTSSVLRFVQSAAQDPHVLAIKQTLYRTSGDSPIIEALIEAAEAGKQVLAVIEIRARFDEQANVRWARKLEAAGVHVVYGLMGLKTHAKLSLIIRDEPQGLRRYCHVGTGNYHPKTARMYEDLGLLSADPELTDDLTKLFNQLSGFAPQSTYSRLLVAPRTLRSGIIERIDNEINNAKSGKPAGIELKLNSILDEVFVTKLYEASAAGVKIKLLIRGICAVQPGIPGLSENITVKSVLGRFLEHSRIYHFTNAGKDEYWIGSADLMGRNLDRRVESLIRIDRKEHQQRLQEILDLGLSDQTSSWNLTGTNWSREGSDDTGQSRADVHAVLIEHYRKNR